MHSTANREASEMASVGSNPTVSAREEDEMNAYVQLFLGILVVCAMWKMADRMCIVFRTRKRGRR